MLNYNYKPFLGNLQPSDIANRLQRTLDYVVPYERGVLASMNTGSPHVLHSRRWERFDAWSTAWSRTSMSGRSTEFGETRRRRRQWTFV